MYHRRTLARSYNDEQHLDGGDHEKLQMLETYLQMQVESAEGAEAMTPALDAERPARAEDVDKFMAELAAAAAGSLPPADHEAVDSEQVTRL